MLSFYVFHFLDAISLSHCRTFMLAFLDLKFFFINFVRSFLDVIIFSLFKRYSKLAALSFSQESFKKNCERIVRNIIDDELAEAFLPWKDLCKKNVHVGGKNIQKQPSFYNNEY